MSTSLDDIESALGAALTSPKHVRVDSIDVDKPSIPDQIAAAKFLQGVASTKDFAKAFTRIKIVPPGSV